MSEDMEIQIWAYIDRSCSEAEYNRVADLIATNPEWQEKHHELIAFHHDLTTETDLIKAPENMAEHILQAIPAKQQVSGISRKIQVITWCIRAVAAFFIISMGICLINIIPTIEITTYAGNMLPEFNWNYNVPELAMSNNSRYVYIAYIGLIAIVVISDYLLRKKLKAYSLLA